MSWGCALSLSKAIDVEKNASIKQLRYSRDRRGLLGVLSSTGELQTLQLGRQFVDEEERLANSPELLQIHKSCVLEYSWGHESFGKPPNTRIDSFDWVRMNDDNHTPRVVYRRFDASLGIAVEPSIGTGKLFDVLNIQSNKMSMYFLVILYRCHIQDKLLLASSHTGISPSHSAPSSFSPSVPQDTC